MLIKKNLVVSLVATSGLLTIPQVALAKNIVSYEDYRNYCSPAAYQYGIQSSDCDRYQGIYENRLQQELNQQQNIRRRNKETANDIQEKNRIRSYVGGSFGAFFPTEDKGDFFDLGSDLGELNLNTGIGGSLFAGAKFNKYFATDLEFILLGGGAEFDNVLDEFFDDLDYSQWGILINPRLILPLSSQKNAVALFLSPGLGISKGEVDWELDGDDDTRRSIEEDISFTWQVKLGLSVPFGDRYSGFTQVRYVNPVEDNTIDSISTEAGFAVEF